MDLPCGSHTDVPLSKQLWDVQTASVLLLHPALSTVKGQPEGKLMEGSEG